MQGGSNTLMNKKSNQGLGTSKSTIVGKTTTSKQSQPSREEKIGPILKKTKVPGHPTTKRSRQVEC